jgi:tripartite-type tricarboxylate transporter receptor subunit TctC
MTPIHRTRRHALRALAALPVAGASLAPRAAVAQERVVKFVLPNATGSGVDAITRAMQPAFAKLVGASVIVENQPGAGVIFPNIHKTLPFAIPDDFTIVTVCGYTPIVLVVNPKVPAKDSRELVALMKSKPDALTYGSSGAGTILHLAAAMYLDETGTQARHVPYKGVGPMVTDLLGGHVDFVTAALPSVQQHLKSGALRAIGVGTDRRIAAAPEIPTFVEQGVPKYVVEAWFAVLGPKGMAPAEVQKVRDAVAAALATPEVKETMDRQGNVINVLSIDAAQKFVRTEMVKYAALSKKIGLEAQ